MKRRDEEIVTEIVKEIKTANPAAAVDKVYVRDQIDELRKPRDPDFKYQRDNKKYAADIIRWIKDGQRLLAGRPDAFHPDLLFRRAPTKPDWIDLFLMRAGSYEPTRSILKDLLAGMRKQCDLIIQGKIGAHRSSGEEQERAAWASGKLMDLHALPWAYSSESSVYRKVARLFLEAMTGRTSKNGADIYRACKAVARNRELAAGIAFALLPNTRTEIESKT
jgi:hypothetical protein